MCNLHSKIKQKGKIALTVICLFFASHLMLGQGQMQQQVQEQEQGPVTLQDQYERLMRQNNTWEDYKVIKINRMENFWRIVSDSLAKNQQTIANAYAEIEDLNAQIEGLASQLSETRALLIESNEKNESIGFLGFTITKSAYHIVTWTLIIGFLLVAMIIYFMYRRSNSVTVRYRNDHEKLSREFDDYREKAHKKQIQLKRELQTAINKLEENKIRM